MELNRDSEALPFLEQATKLDPDCSEAWHDLEVTLSRLKHGREELG
jgi:hypothetical protein